MSRTDYAGNRIVGDGEFDDAELPNGIDRVYAHAIIVEYDDEGKMKRDIKTRNYSRDRGGAGSKPIGSAYRHQGKWRHDFLLWNLWKFEGD
jgi:hypothetical protein